ncbi:MAG: VWA domain-containing protein [bacterium]
MQAYILQFADFLRESGMRISTAEILDALTGLGHIDLLEKRQFKTLLRASLVKRAADLREFDKLFDLFFSSFEVPGQALSPVSSGALEGPIRELLEQANGLFSPWFRKLLLEGLPAFAAAMLDTGRQVGLQGMRYPLQARHFGHRMRREFGMEQWGEQIAHLLGRLAERGAPESDLAALEQEIAQRSALLGEMIQEHVDRRARMLLDADRKREVHEDLMLKGFGALTPWEIQSMRRVVQDLVKKIRDESSLRERRSRRGRLDIKHTLRRSLRYGGVPLEMVLRKRKRSKGRVVVLCDVSQSVWNASRFMLHLLYSLQDQFSKVRSFVFVDELGEVTGCFERYEVNEAIERALKDAGIPYNRYTDYGSVFKEFCAKYADAVNRKTTFIVIGDGRNNFFLPGEEFLERIRSRARRVIWLNPESRGFWKVGDSMMHRYGRHCDEVRECRNLKQLIEFVSALTL